MIVIFLETTFTIIEIVLAKMRAGMNEMSLKKDDCTFIHINISSLFPKYDEVHYITNITNVSIFGISEAKLEEIIWSNELEVDGYNLVKLN